jgi:hypothetical protein
MTLHMTAFGAEKRMGPTLDVPVFRCSSQRVEPVTDLAEFDQHVSQRRASLLLDSFDGTKTPHKPRGDGGSDDADQCDADDHESRTD